MSTIGSSLGPTALPVPTVEAVPWSSNLTTHDYSLLLGLPLGAFILIILLLRVIWRGKSAPKFSLPKNVPTYGTVDSDDGLPSNYAYDGMSNDLIYAGQVAGRYDTPWTKTFDFIFLVGMAVFTLVMIFLTAWFKPSLWSNTAFWISLLPKIIAMISVSCIGGVICRFFCVVDEKGYVITERHSKFKVNYTRKFQLMAAYLIPFIVKPDASCDCNGSLELAWGDYVTMLCFLMLIKPIRERSTFFMLQFNSLDRPEDRPHTLKWIVAGNVFPGLLILLYFKWLFARTTQSDLVFIPIFVTIIGDGLAEPVGTAFGRHKYSVRSCMSNRKYTRSFEGSACVFLAGMIFPALQYFDFADPNQLWITMVVLPFVAAYAEATAPHTMDAPILMTAAGIVLYTVIHLV
jgi:dolichol kinase